MVVKPQKTKFQLKIVENIETLSIWAKIHGEDIQFH